MSVGEGTFDSDDLEVLGSLDRAPWDEGRPVSAEEVEVLRLEFQAYVDTAIEGEAYALACWVYRGGLDLVRKMDSDPTSP